MSEKDPLNPLARHAATVVGAAATTEVALHLAFQNAVLSLGAFAAVVGLGALAMRRARPAEAGAEVVAFEIEAEPEALDDDVLTRPLPELPPAPAPEPEAAPLAEAVPDPVVLEACRRLERDLGGLQQQVRAHAATLRTEAHAERAALHADLRDLTAGLARVRAGLDEVRVDQASAETREALAALQRRLDSVREEVSPLRAASEEAREAGREARAQAAKLEETVLRIASAAEDGFDDMAWAFRRASEEEAKRHDERARRVLAAQEDAARRLERALRAAQEEAAARAREGAALLEEIRVRSANLEREAEAVRRDLASLHAPVERASDAAGARVAEAEARLRQALAEHATRHAEADVKLREVQDALAALPERVDARFHDKLASQHAMLQSIHARLEERAQALATRMDRHAEEARRWAVGERDAQADADARAAQTLQRLDDIQRDHAELRSLLHRAAGQEPAHDALRRIEADLAREAKARAAHARETDAMQARLLESQDAAERAVQHLAGRLDARAAELADASTSLSESLAAAREQSTRDARALADTLASHAAASAERDERAAQHILAWEERMRALHAEQAGRLDAAAEAAAQRHADAAARMLDLANAAQEARGREGAKLRAQLAEAKESLSQEARQRHDDDAARFDRLDERAGSALRRLEAIDGALPPLAGAVDGAHAKLDELKAALADAGEAHAQRHVETQASTARLASTVSDEARRSREEADSHARRLESLVADVLREAREHTREVSEKAEQLARQAQAAMTEAAEEASIERDAHASRLEVRIAELLQEARLHAHAASSQAESLARHARDALAEATREAHEARRFATEDAHRLHGDLASRLEAQALAAREGFGRADAGLAEIARNIEASRKENGGVADTAATQAKLALARAEEIAEAARQRAQADAARALDALGGIDQRLGELAMAARASHETLERSFAERIHEAQHAIEARQAASERALQDAWTDEARALAERVDVAIRSLAAPLDEARERQGATEAVLDDLRAANAALGLDVGALHDETLRVHHDVLAAHAEQEAALFRVAAEAGQERRALADGLKDRVDEVRDSLAREVDRVATGLHHSLAHLGAEEEARQARLLAELARAQQAAEAAAKPGDVQTAIEQAATRVDESMARRDGALHAALHLRAEAADATTARLLDELALVQEALARSASSEELAHLLGVERDLASARHADVARQLDALRDVGERLRASVEDANRHAEAQAAARDDAMRRALDSATASHAARLDDALLQRAHADQAERALAQARQELLTLENAQALAQTRAALESRMDEAGERVEDAFGLMQDTLAAQRLADAQRDARLDGTLRDLMAGIAARATPEDVTAARDDVLRALASAAARTDEQAASVLAALADAAEAARAAERDAAARVGDLASVFTSEHLETRDTLDAGLARLATQVERADERAQAGATDLEARLRARADEHAAAADARAAHALRAVMERLDEETHQAERRATSVVDALAERMDAQSRLLDEQAKASAGALAERLDAASSRADLHAAILERATREALAATLGVQEEVAGFEARLTAWAQDVTPRLARLDESLQEARAEARGQADSLRHDLATSQDAILKPLDRLATTLPDAITRLGERALADAAARDERLGAALDAAHAKLDTLGGGMDQRFQDAERHLSTTLDAHARARDEHVTAALRDARAHADAQAAALDERAAARADGILQGVAESRDQLATRLDASLASLQAQNEASLAALRERLSSDVRAAADAATEERHRAEAQLGALGERLSGALGGLAPLHERAHAHAARLDEQARLLAEGFASGRADASRLHAALDATHAEQARRHAEGQAEAAKRQDALVASLDEHARRAHEDAVRLMARIGAQEIALGERLDAQGVRLESKLDAHGARLETKLDAAAQGLAQILEAERAATHEALARLAQHSARQAHLLQASDDARRDENAALEARLAALHERTVREVAQARQAMAITARESQDAASRHAAETARLAPRLDAAETTLRAALDATEARLAGAMQDVRASLSALQDRTERATREAANAAASAQEPARRLDARFGQLETRLGDAALQAERREQATLDRLEGLDARVREVALHGERRELAAQARFDEPLRRQDARLVSLEARLDRGLADLQGQLSDATRAADERQRVTLSQATEPARRVEARLADLEAKLHQMPGDDAFVRLAAQLEAGRDASLDAAMRRLAPRLAGLESRLDDLAAREPSARPLERRLDALEARLAEIADKLGRAPTPAPVSAQPGAPEAKRVRAKLTRKKAKPAPEPAPERIDPEAALRATLSEETLGEIRARRVW